MEKMTKFRFSVEQARQIVLDMSLDSDMQDLGEGSEEEFHHNDGEEEKFDESETDTEE